MSRPLFLIILSILISLAQNTFKTLDGSKLISLSYSPNTDYDASEIVSNENINQNMISYYTWFASYGYCTDDQIPTYCCKNYKDFFTNKWTIIDKSSIKDYYDYNYVIWRNDEYKKFIFSFPGTRNDIIELLGQAMNSKLVNYYKNNNSIKVVNYFYQVLNSIKSLVFSTKTLQDIKNHPGYQLVFTGHSLGGSIAALMLYTGFVENHIDSSYNPAIITFAMPRIGNKNWVIDFNSKIKNILRVVRNGDIVDSLPYGFMKNKYCHYGGLILVNKELNSMNYCPQEIGEIYKDKECKREKNVDIKYHLNYFNPDLILPYRCGGTFAKKAYDFFSTVSYYFDALLKNLYFL